MFYIINMIKRSLVILLILLISGALCSQYYNYLDDQVIHNPFKDNYGSLLDYKRFNIFNQFSVFSFSSSRGHSGTYGLYLNTIQYNINSDLSAYLHLGKKFDFNSKEDSLEFNDKKDYLSGGTVIYKPGSDFTLGMEYGSAPGISPLNYSFSGNPFFSDSYYLPNSDDKNLILWLNKGFNRNRFNIHLQVQQIERKTPLPDETLQ